MSSLKSLSVNGVKWYLIGDGANIAFSFVIGIILARLLTPDDYGTIGVYGIFFALANIFINGGFSMSLIHKREIDDADCSTAFWANIVVGVFFFALFYFTSPLIADFFNIPILTDIIRVSAIGLLIGAFTVVQTTLFNKRVDFKTTASIRFASNAFAGILCVILAYNGFGVWSLVIQGLVSGILSALLLWFFSSWRPKLMFSWQAFRELFSFGGKILGTRLLECLSGQASSFVLGKAFSARDLGYYQKGAAYARLFSTTFSNAIFGVSFPVLSKIDDDETLIYVFRRYIKVTSMIIFFTMLLLCALAHPMIVFLYTEKWEMSATLMQIVIFGIMFDHLVGLNSSIFNVKGRSDIQMKLQIYKSTILLSLIGLSLRFGVYGVCFAEVIYYQLAIMVCSYHTKKLIGYGYFEQMRDAMPYLLMSVVAVAPSYLLVMTSLPLLVILCVASVVSVVLYCIILYFKQDEVFMQYVWNDARVVKCRTKFMRK